MRRCWSRWLTRVGLSLGVLATAAVSSGFEKPDCFVTAEPAQVTGLDGWQVTPVLTIGEVDGNGDPIEFDGYVVPGILDGIGAYRSKGRTVRILVNHEFAANRGYPYTLANGTMLTGGRVSYVDIDRRTWEVCGAGLAYDTIYNQAGEVVDDASDLDFGGLNRLCSSVSYERGEFGLRDDIYFTGEEADGGLEYALDVANGKLWAVPALGRAGWENVTLIDTGRWWETAVIVGDDRSGKPLWLYVGCKKPWMVGPQHFLARNGLDGGRLYAWVADGATSPEDFNGTGSCAAGRFVEIDYYRPDLAGNGDYDALGYATQSKQDALAADVGAFQFSRPEDVAHNPRDKSEFVLASTGRGSSYPSDNWGTIYTIDVKVRRKWWLFGPLTPSAEACILYDGDDAGAGQFPTPDDGIRSPDNLDWSEDGSIYVQEDRSTSPGSLFGGTSGREASIWQLSPVTGTATRIGEIDRTAVPTGQSDPVPTDIGNWESSGILDVSDLFGVKKGTLLIADTQAHSLRDGAIASENLVEGGQLFFLFKRDGKKSGK